MPFKSEAQKRYLWANEPEIARDWTDTYGSRIQKSNGGIMSMQGGVKNYLGEQPMVSAPKYWQSAPDHEMTELAYITPRERDVLVNMDMYGSMNGSPNEGPSGIMSLNGWGDKDQGFGSPGGGTANTGGHGYGDQERSYTRSTDAGRGTETVTVSPKDHFEQSWSGQPGFLGLGGGYRNLKTPNEAGSGYQSRLNPMGLMSLLGGFISRPFSLAVSGINAARNKFGPAFNNFTSSKTLEEFRDKMRGYGRTMPTYSPYLKFGGIETLGQEMPEETNIDNSMWGADQDIFGIENARGLFRPHQMSTDFNIKYGPEGITYYEDELPEEDVITGTNYPNETETILDKAKRINKAMQDSIDKTDLDEMELKINRARWNRNPPWPAM